MIHSSTRPRAPAQVSPRRPRTVINSPRQPLRSRATDGSRLVQSPSGSLGRTPGICVGHGLSARLAQTPCPCLGHGGAGATWAGEGDQRTKPVLGEQQPDQQRQHTTSYEHGSTRPRHPCSARRTGPTQTASTLGELPLCVLSSGTAAMDGGADNLLVQQTSLLTANNCLVQSNQNITADSGANVTAGLAQATGVASGPITPAPQSRSSTARRATPRTRVVAAASSSKPSARNHPAWRSTPTPTPCMR